MSRVEEEVCFKLLKRADVGKAKYGVTMERDDLSVLDWLKHTQEELMDACVYIEKLIDEKQKEKSNTNCCGQGGLQEWVRTSSLEEFGSTTRKRDGLRDSKD